MASTDNSESFSASGTESLFSSSAGSSTISVRGPGSLAGKFISNLGKITLKGVETITIYGTLYTIGSQSGDEAKSYNDALELSRPGMYSDIIHLKAMRFLVRQIASGQTRHLVDALKNWHPVEIHLLLSKLISHFDGAIQSPSRTMDSVLQAYKLCLPACTIADKDHSFVPFICFLRTLNSSSVSLSPIIFEAGLLDFLLHLYATDFYDPLALPCDRTGYCSKSALLIACNSLLIASCENDYGGVTAYIQRHPIHALWSIHPALPLFSHNVHDSSAETQRVLRRKEAWRCVEKRWIYWRISSIHDMMADFPRHLEHNTRNDVFVDLVQFAGSNLFDDQRLAFRALRSLHQMLHRENHWPGAKVDVHLEDEHTCTYAKEAFTHIVRNITALAEDPFHPHFYFEFDMPLFRQNAMVHFIQWMSRTANGDLGFRRWVVSSGILKLIEVTSRRSDFIFDPEDDIQAQQRQYRQKFLSWAPLVFRSKVIDSPAPLERQKEETWDNIVVRPQNKAMLYEWIDSLDNSG